MYHAIARRTVRDLWVEQGVTVVRLSGVVMLRFGAGHIEFGHGPQTVQDTPSSPPRCCKNIEMEPCTLEFVRSIAVGTSITSAGDFGTYLEVGLDQRYNLGLHEFGFHI